MKIRVTNVPAVRPLWLVVIGPNLLGVDLNLARKSSPNITEKELLKSIALVYKDIIREIIIDKETES